MAKRKRITFRTKKGVVSFFKRKRKPKKVSHRKGIGMIKRKLNGHRLKHGYRLIKRKRKDGDERELEV
jgi:hypothetical protein